MTSFCLIFYTMKWSNYSLSTPFLSLCIYSISTLNCPHVHQLYCSISTLYLFNIYFWNALYPLYTYWPGAVLDCNVWDGEHPRLLVLVAGEVAPNLSIVLHREYSWSHIVLYCTVLCPPYTTWRCRCDPCPDHTCILAPSCRRWNTTIPDLNNPLKFKSVLDILKFPTSCLNIHLIVWWTCSNTCNVY